MVIVMPIGLVALIIEDLHQDIVSLLAGTWLSLVVCEMLWIRSLLSELNVLRKGTSKLWCDNKSAINIANNPVQHDRTKHVEVDRFFIKEKIDEGTLELSHVILREQLADCLTKGLGVKECELACSKMGMIDIYHPS